MSEIPTSSNSLCPLPWVNMSVDVDGTNRPCCKFAHHREESGYQMGNLKTHSLEKLWHSDGMVRLRKDLRQGLRPSECQTCWSEEAAGVPSYRQTYTIGRIEDVVVDYSEDYPSNPVTLDLKLSNVCNLKCRICGPVASSLWLKEIQETAFQPSLEAEKEFLLSNKITQKPENLATFKSWLPHLRHVEVFGGEPLLSKENREIERLMIESGNAHQISLLYNTNITVFRDELVEDWRKFRQVTLSLSLDDLGERLEYERNPAQWKVVRENVLKYAKIKTDQLKVVLFCSVSSQNVWYLPEYLEWVVENVPNLEVHFNLVHNPAEFCIQNLPEALKQKVRQKFETWKHDLSRHYKGEELRHRLLSVADFMVAESMKPECWRQFLTRTATLDRIRKQSFSAIFPEFSKEIQSV